MGDYLTCAKANALGCYPVHPDDNCRRVCALDVAGEAASPPSQISTNGELYTSHGQQLLVHCSFVNNKLFVLL